MPSEEGLDEGDGVEMEGGVEDPAQGKEGDDRASDGDVGEPVGAGDEAGKAAEEGVEPGEGAEPSASEEGIAGGKEKESGGVVCRKA